MKWIIIKGAENKIGQEFLGRQGRELTEDRVDMDVKWVAPFNAFWIRLSHAMICNQPQDARDNNPHEQKIDKNHIQDEIYSLIKSEVKYSYEAEGRDLKIKLVKIF